MPVNCRLSGQGAETGPRTGVVESRPKRDWTTENTMNAFEMVFGTVSSTALAANYLLS